MIKFSEDLSSCEFENFPDEFKEFEVDVGQTICIAIENEFLAYALALLQVNELLSAKLFEYASKSICLFATNEGVLARRPVFITSLKSFPRLEEEHWLASASRALLLIGGSQTINLLQNSHIFRSFDPVSLIITAYKSSRFQCGELIGLTGKMANFYKGISVPKGEVEFFFETLPLSSSPDHFFRKKIQFQTALESFYLGWCAYRRGSVKKGWSLANRVVKLAEFNKAAEVQKKLDEMARAVLASEIFDIDEYRKGVNEALSGLPESTFSQLKNYAFLLWEDVKKRVKTKCLQKFEKHSNFLVRTRADGLTSKKAVQGAFASLEDWYRLQIRLRFSENSPEFASVEKEINEQKIQVDCFLRSRLMVSLEEALTDLAECVFHREAANGLRRGELRSFSVALQAALEAFEKLFIYRRALPEVSFFLNEKELLDIKQKQLIATLTTLRETARTMFNELRPEFFAQIWIHGLRESRIPLATLNGFAGQHCITYLTSNAVPDPKEFELINPIAKVEEWANLYDEYIKQKAAMESWELYIFYLKVFGWKVQVYAVERMPKELFSLAIFVMSPTGLTLLFAALIAKWWTCILG